MRRVFAAHNPENEAENHAIRGRARAVAGDFTAGLQDLDKAVTMDSKNVYNYLNRADVYHMMGNTEAALADLAQAKEVDKANPYGWLMSAQIYEELGQQADALANYQEFYRLRPKAFRVIPEEYLQSVSEKDYKTVQKEKADAKKKYEQQWNKEHKDKKAAEKHSAAKS